MSNIRELILSVIVVILLVVFGIKQLGGIVVEVKNNFGSKREKQAIVEDLRIKVDSITQANERIKKQQDVLKPFYKQDFAPNDSIASFGGMFEDVINYVKINGLLLRTIEYNLNPEEDPIFKNFASAYNVCEIKMFLIGTYPQIQGFMNDIELYPYYISVDQINIMPYENNKKYLLANVSIHLYSKKGS